MALGDLLIKVGIDGSNIGKDLAKVQRKLEASASRFSSIGANISMGISAPLGLLANQAITTAAEFETLETGLQTLTGSVDKGTAAFERLKEFSAATPFQLQDLVAANNTMMGFGLSSDDAFDSLNQLGNIAAVMGSDLNSMSLAFGQSAASGVAMTADINQFINQGVPMYKLLGNVTGKSTAELKKMASESKITFPLIQEALEKATSEGGMFFEGMKKGSQTIGGVLSTFKDKLALALGTLGQSIAKALDFKTMMANLGDVIGRITNTFAGFSDTTKRIIVVIVGAVAALGPLMFALGGLTNVVVSAVSGLRLLNTTLLANPFVAIAAVVIAIAIAFKKLYDESNEFRGVVNKLINTFKNTFGRLLSTIRQLVDHLREAFTGITTEGDSAKSMLVSIGEFIGNILVKRVQRAVDVIRFLVDGFIDLYNSSDLFRGVLFGMVNGVKTLIEQVLRGLGSLAKAIGLLFKKEFKKAGNEAKKGARQFLTAGQQAKDAFFDGFEKGASADSRLKFGVKEAVEEVVPELTKVTEEVDKVAAQTAGAGEETRTYRDELADLDKLLGDSLIDRNKALADALSIVREEMIKTSLAAKDNVFGESVSDLKEYEKQIKGLQETNKETEKVMGLGERNRLLGESFTDIKIPDLTAQIDKITVKPGKIEFTDVSNALQVLGLGGPLVGAFDNLFASIEKKSTELGRKMKSAFMISLGAFDLIRQAFDIANAAKQRKMEEDHKLELQRIEASTASEEVKQKRKALAEQQFEKKSQAIKKRMAQKDKARAMFEAAINTAAAIAKVAANPLMIPIVAALGAAQVAMIAATPIPMAKGGILSGPTNILAGEYMGARNNPEIIAPLDKLRNMINTEQNINLQGAFRLTGDDLLLAVEQANKTRQRQGGITLF